LPLEVGALFSLATALQKQRSVLNIGRPVSVCAVDHYEEKAPTDQLLNNFTDFNHVVLEEKTHFTGFLPLPCMKSDIMHNQMQVFCDDNTTLACASKHPFPKSISI